MHLIPVCMLISDYTLGSYLGTISKRAKIAEEKISG